MRQKLLNRWYHFLVGDCNLSCIGNPPSFGMHPVPKISYPGEEQALHAVHNMNLLEKGFSIMFMSNSNNPGATVDLRPLTYLVSTKAPFDKEDEGLC